MVGAMRRFGGSQYPIGERWLAERANACAGRAIVLKKTSKVWASFGLHVYRR